MNNNSIWLPDEDFKDLSANFFDDLIDHIDDFPLEDIETANDEQDWGAEFKNLVPPPLDVLSSLSSSDFTGNNGQRVRVQKPAPILKESSSLEASSTIDSSSADVKVSKLFQSSSPVSVLENTNGSASSQNQNSAQRFTFPVKGFRSKRKRPSLLRMTFLRSLTSSVMPQLFANAPDESDSEDTYFPSESSTRKKRKKIKYQSAFSSILNNPEVVNADGTIRKCSHCETTRTPQWREGPNGPKTLCNACGVRFRSGRLLPEYRPASSPTFIPTVHSNSHRKVVEMRRKEENKFVARKSRAVTSRG